jgi:hypothetical protein
VFIKAAVGQSKTCSEKYNAPTCAGTDYKVIYIISIHMLRKMDGTEEKIYKCQRFKN